MQGISKDNLCCVWHPSNGMRSCRSISKSVFNMTKQVIRPMMKAKSGTIINMSSVIGEMGNAGQSSYAVKWASIIRFSKKCGQRTGQPQYPLNAIAPGFVEIDMTSYLKEGEGAEKYKAGSRWGVSPPVRISPTWPSSGERLGQLYHRANTISACGGLNISDRPTNLFSYRLFNKTHLKRTVYLHS